MPKSCRGVCALSAHHLLRRRLGRGAWPLVTGVRHRARRTRPRPAPLSRRPHLMERERWRRRALLRPGAADELSQHVGDPSLQRPAPWHGRSQEGAAAAGGGGDRLPRDRGAGRAVGGRGQRQGGGPAGHGRRHRQPLPGAGQAPSPSPSRPASLPPSPGSSRTLSSSVLTGLQPFGNLPYRSTFPTA